jgi:hypothetical protein
MVSAKRSPGKCTRIVLLACLAAVLDWSLPGCSQGGGGSSLSPEDRARAKEMLKKRFEEPGEKTGRKAPR